MKLFHKTLAAVALTIFVLVIFLSFFWRDTLMASYNSFERVEMKLHIERALNTLLNDAREPSTRLNDWAAWDSSWRFMQDQEKGFIENNFPKPFTLTDIGMHIVVFVSEDAVIKHSLAVQPVGTPEWQPLPEGFKPHLRQGAPLVTHRALQSRVEGFVVTPEGILEVGSHPITHGDKTGPARGSLIFASYLTPEKIQRLGSLINLPFKVWALNDLTLGSELAAVRERLTAGADGHLEIVARDEEEVTGYALVNDIYGQPAFLVSAAVPRSIYQQGLKTVRQSLFLLSFTGILFAVLNMFLLRGIVLKRLAHLSDQVAEIGSRGNLAARVDVSGGDEIATVGQTVNGMLTQLESSQAALFELEAWRKGEQRYTDLMDASPAFALIISSGTIVYANPNAARGFGYEHSSQLLGRSLTELLIAGEPTQTFLADISKLLAGELSVLRMELKAVHTDGKMIDLEVAANTMSFKDVASIQLLAQDVTETNQAQDRLTRMGKEMEIATRIQTVLVPQELPIQNFDLAMALHTAAEVGGDLIDYLPQSDGRFWLAIGDVTGHGLTPGLVMMMAQSFVTAYLLDAPEQTPTECLQRVNAALFQNVHDRMQNDNYMTLQLLHHTGDGHFVAAGMHCDILIWRSATQQVERLEIPGFWTGLLRDISEMTQDLEFSLEPGDILLLYSDGLIEAANQHNEQYDMERLEQALSRYASLPVSSIKEEIVAEVKAWLLEQADDISIIVLRRWENDGGLAPIQGSEHFA
ncbi:MAG: SpoIIE family protein phosphatase [Candidatus Sericytochromatia bacterium]|nr:SpoIIE family protein phosphatase [Candidatus Sericytochromatia bacterium]